MGSLRGARGREQGSRWDGDGVFGHWRPRSGQIFVNFGKFWVENSARGGFLGGKVLVFAIFDKKCACFVRFTPCGPQRCPTERAKWGHPRPSRTPYVPVAVSWSQRLFRNQLGTRRRVEKDPP